MLERLKTVMDHYQLTASQLADRLGIPRSSISHLLSGRNKPSLDFVLKLIREFPEINLYWLLNGKGEFPASSRKSAVVPSPTLLESSSAISQASVTKKSAEAAMAKERELEKIVFFYTDGSFQSFDPKK